MADDGIKLTKDERDKIIDTGRHVYGCCSDHCEHNGLPEDAQIVAVESIFAARLQALTAERDELRGALNDQCDWGNAVADRDAARAELAAANTRIAELEERLVLRTRQWTRHAQNIEAGRDAALDDLNREYAENAALSARLERVRALADEWDKPYGEFMGHPDDVAALRAALGRTHDTRTVD